MKKAFIFPLALVLALAFASVASAEIATSKMAFGNVTVHTVSSTGGQNAALVENTKLVVFDSFEGADAQAYRKFIDSLGKPVDRVILSHAHAHHFKEAAQTFANIPLFSIDAADINKEIPMNVQPLADGNLTVDGVDYEFVTYRGLNAWVIKMPAQKVAMVHHLGYLGLHFPMPPMEARLDILKGLEREGYAWYIGGHGKAPVDQSFVQEIAAYTKVVTEAVAANKDPQGAKAAIMAKYPAWAGEGLLDGLLPLFYKK